MGIAGLDFTKLSLRDAIDLAVLIEEEARDRYQELADQLTLHHTPEAAAFFDKMSRVEEFHRKQLSIRRLNQFGDQPTTVSRQMIFDVEAPEYDEARAFMSVRQALNTALRAETKAHDFFIEALRSVKDPGVAALFNELREEEVHHQNMVRAEIAKLPPDAEPESGDDSADEPQAL